MLIYTYLINHKFILAKFLKPNFIKIHLCLNYYDSYII
jgi:hypothetical protein